MVPATSPAYSTVNQVLLVLALVLSCIALLFSVPLRTESKLQNLADSFKLSRAAGAGAGETASLLGGGFNPAGVVADGLKEILSAVLERRSCPPAVSSSDLKEILVATLARTCPSPLECPPPYTASTSGTGELRSQKAIMNEREERLKEGEQALARREKEFKAEEEASLQAYVQSWSAMQAYAREHSIPLMGSQFTSKSGRADHEALFVRQSGGKGVPATSAKDLDPVLVSPEPGT